ncbi:MAG: sensor histidine kinase, partial [Fusobacteriaceae bacterium]
EEDKKKYYSIIFKKTLEMKELINNLLVLSKLESFQNEVKREKINIKNLIEESLEKYDYIEYEKDLEINNNISDIFLVGDPRILQVVFNNIIQNAFKYSVNNGKINIFEEDNKLFIQNEFAGKLNLEKSNIFEPFKRGENTLEYQTDGSGLGLSMVRDAFDFMGIKYFAKVEDNKFIFAINIREKNIK